jgi:hypothetical protein
MGFRLSTVLGREQRAFLGRSREGWEAHLARTRGFLGEGLAAAPPDRPVLILGAGSGLEVPWGLAPPRTWGWDADPWSRLRTALRHRRFAAWVFEDLTGGLADLAATAQRSLGHPWSGRRRPAEQAAARLAGLLPSLQPRPEALAAWIAQHRPGAILAANVLGQIAPLAHRLVTGAFAPSDPWNEDPEQPDPLAEALDAWVARALGQVFGVLRESGAALWMVHDRGVIHGGAAVELGPPAEPWTAQLRATEDLELSDPLCGLDVREALPVDRLERWLWPVGLGQVHVMEAVVSQPRP